MPVKGRRDSNIALVPLYWLLLLELGSQSPGLTESALRHFHANDDFWQHRPADHASFCRPKSLVRSPRTSCQDLLMASLYHVQCGRRVTVEYADGCNHLLLLVLPHRHVQECDTRWTSARARGANVLVNLGLSHVYVNLYAHGRCWH